MSYRVASASQNLLRAARPSPRVCARRSLASTSILRAEPTPAAASSSPPPPPANLSPKLATIVDQISTLTLLEAADLVDALK
ncbi:hypothetical protein JCM3775_001732, partial [Rhodotorula graminis]